MRPGRIDSDAHSLPYRRLEGHHYGQYDTTLLCAILTILSVEQATAQHITSAIVLQVTADGDDQRKFHVVLHRIFDHKHCLQSVTARSRAGQCRASEESFAIDNLLQV